MDNLQYLQVFLEESAENIQLLNTVCLKMEQSSPEDDDFATMFRAAHTLKGMSATMGFNGMAGLTHRLEDVLGHLRQHPDQMTSEFVDTVFASIDALESALSDIRDAGAESDVHHTNLIRRLDAMLGKSQSAARGEVAAAANAPTAADVTFAAEGEIATVYETCQNQGLILGFLRVDLDESCVMKGPRAIMIANAIENHGDSLQCNPAAQDMEMGNFSGPLRFLVAIHTSEQALVEAVNRISEVRNVQFVTYTPQESLTSMTATPDIKEPAKSAASKAGNTRKPGAADKMEKTIRVPVERLDTFMNLLSELVMDKTRLADLARQSAHSGLKDVTDHLSRISNELQSAVMSLRMVPIDMLFQRFPRLVRDLSKTLKKDIHLEMSGLDTEFDRTIIDEMGEALVHMIRNSADHGLEETADRVRNGKPATGTIYLRAYPSGQHVYIEVADDGGGIHVEKVRSRAAERGITSPSAAKALTDEQVYELLFESGFSTSDSISDISGRGVGLDAVKRKVESLSGRIFVESESGQGTTFRIQLPLTMSILQALLVGVEDDVFAVALGSVEEVVHASDSDLRQVHGQTVLSYRDKLVPILDLGDWMFGLSTLRQKPWKLVICKEGNKRLAVAVGSLYGQQEIVNKSLGEYLKSNRWFSGAAILGDGSIALIMDTHALMTL